MSDDEFDLDFIGNASKKVHENWDNKFPSVGKFKENPSPEKNAVLNVAPTPPKRSKGKENCESVSIHVSDDDENVAVTPPSSMPNTPQSTVRGAARTKKTQKALEKLLKSSDSLKRNDSNVSISDETTVVLSDDEDEKDIEIKVKWKSEILRVNVTPKEKMGKIADRIADNVGLPVGELNLFHNKTEKIITRDETVGGLKLSIVSVLQARARLQSSKDTSNDDGIELKLQTKDRRAQPLIVKVRPTDSMDIVMQKFSDESSTPREKLKFFFDGEELVGTDTVEDLELEGGECFDVHVSS